MNNVVEKQIATHSNIGACVELPDLNQVISRHKDGDLEYAQKGYQSLIDANQASALIYSNLATIHNLKKEHTKAIRLLEQAIQIDPQYADAHLILGCTIELHEEDRIDDAINYYLQALEMSPEHPKILNILGNSLHKKGATVEAINYFQRATVAQPDNYIAHFNLGTLLILEDRLKEASVSFQNALDINGSLGGALSKLWYLRMRMSDWSDYSAQLPDLKSSIYNILEHTESPDVMNTVTPFPLLGVFDDPEILHATAQQYVRAITTEVKLTEPLYNRRNRNPEDIIKIAFLATDYHNHPTTFLVAELFELLDPQQFEIHAITHNRVNEHSEIRERIKSVCNNFYDLTDHSDEEIAHFIADLNIDIAVDLKGLTEGCRPGILSHRPAPVQVRLLGFPGSTGTSSIDYFIADKVIIPEEEQANYSEKIMYMPESYQINDRKRKVNPKVPSRQECGLPEDAFVFCTFNHNFKIMPEMFDIWIELLEETPGSVLWLLESNEWAGKNLLSEAKARGADPARIIFAEQLPSAEHLARIQNADLFLDTFPCNAHTTASDALWVGLPVMTCMGRSFAARVAASILKAIDLDELITTDFISYKALALELAHNPKKLNQIKSKLRANRDTCSLFDTEKYTHDLQKGLIHMLDLHDEGTKATSFHISDVKDNQKATTIRTEKQMRIPYQACPLCDSQNFEASIIADCSHHPLYKTPLPAKMIWMICSDCDHNFTNGYFTDDAFDLVFSDTNVHQMVGHNIEEARKVSAVMIEKVMPYCSEGKWLDVGFGNAALLLTAYEYGYEPAGIEMRLDNVTGLQAFGAEAFHGKMEDYQGNADIVSMMNLLEHMPYPKEGLKAAHRILNENGVLYLSMPNTSSPLWHALNAENRNPYWGELEHFHNFSRERLYALLEEHGFEVKKYGISSRYRTGMEVIATKK